MGIYRADKDPGVGQDTQDWLVVSAGTFHDCPCLALQGQDVISKVAQPSGRMCDIEGLPDNGASRLQDRHGALALGNINTDCVVHVCTSLDNELHGAGGYPLLIQSPGVSYGHAQGSPTCINRTAANGGPADRLICGHLWVQEHLCHTNAHLF